MIRPRKSADRGYFEHGWLESFHTFSFGEYHDPDHTGYRVLRVINEDKVQPGQGFATHPHRNMEIISYIVGGVLEHKDSMGTGSKIVAGEVQYMSAGSGVTHSEFNPSDKEVTHLLQIWIVPAIKDAPPRYDQISIPLDEKKGKWRRLVGNDEPGVISIRQDVGLFATVLTGKTTYNLAAGRHAWVQIIRGSATVNALALEAGDGAAVSAESTLAFDGNAELLLFDLP